MSELPRGQDGVDPSEAGWVEGPGSVVYKGRMTLVEYPVSPDESHHSSYLVDESIPYAVAVLLVDEQNELVLARQYRFPLRRWIFDLPGGGGSASEDPATAARRECEEELGVTPSDLQYLTSFYPNPGRSSWPAHIFIGRGSPHVVAASDDPFERVRYTTMSKESVGHLISTGEAVDPALVIAFSVATMRSLI